MYTSTTDARWRWCCQTEPVVVSFDKGAGSARIPSGFLRRSEMFAQQMKVKNSKLDEPVDMNDVDDPTFWRFFEWSYQQRPELPSLSMEEALALAHLSERYRIKALRNQLSDLFRDRFGKKSWKIDPLALQSICEVDAKDERWLYGMVKVLLGTVTAHFGYAKEGLNIWTQVLDNYPELYRVHFEASLIGTRPQELLDKGACYWHSHAGEGLENDTGSGSNCQRISQECFPEWMDPHATGAFTMLTNTTLGKTNTVSKRLSDTPAHLHRSKKANLSQEPTRSSTLY